MKHSVNSQMATLRCGRNRMLPCGAVIRSKGMTFYIECWLRAARGAWGLLATQSAGRLPWR